MNHRILSTTLLLSLFVIFPPATSSAQSQWTDEGLQLSSEYASYSYVEPDCSGGVWILYDNYNLDILDFRPKLQHFDADGNKLLGPEGMFVCADTMITGWSLGLTCLPDNGVAVAYSWFRFDQDPSTSEIYGQRISATGERLLDSNGVQLTFTNTEMYKGNSDNSSVCGDGSDGMWVVCRQAYTQDRFVVGMNGDGSLKADLQFMAASLEGAGLICEDGNGGAFIFFHDYRYSTFGNVLYYDHVDFEGNIAFGNNNAHRVFEGSDSWFQLVAAKELTDGSLILEASSDGGLLMQRLMPDCSVAWGPAGYEASRSNTRVSSSPVIIEDEIFFAAVYLDDTGRTFSVGKVSKDGNEIQDFTDNIIEEDNSDINYTNPLFVPAHLDTEEYPVAIVRRDRGLDLEHRDYYYTLHKINADGTVDLWASDPPEIGGGRPGYSYDHEYAYSLSDGSILLHLLVRYSQENVIMRREYLYKITAEGHLASAREARHPAQIPNQPEILSAWPNPFNASVTITYSLPANSPATLMIFDLTGREVQRARLVASSGSVYVWQPDAGLASGVYFARLISPGNSTLRKLMLLR